MYNGLSEPLLTEQLPTVSGNNPERRRESEPEPESCMPEKQNNDLTDLENWLGLRKSVEMVLWLLWFWFSGDSSLQEYD